MEKEIPFGVKYARMLNLVNIVIFVLMGLSLIAIAVSEVAKAIQEAGKMGNPIFMLLPILPGLIPLVLAYLLIRLNRALLRLQHNARVIQIVLSCLFLLAFPIGTILYGICLYYMLGDLKTKEAFIKQS